MLNNKTIYFQQKTKSNLKIQLKNPILGANEALAIPAFAISCLGNLVNIYLGEK